MVWKEVATIARWLEGKKYVLKIESKCEVNKIYIKKLDL